MDTYLQFKQRRNRMVRTFTTERFLAFLNRRLYIENGQLHLRAPEEVGRQHQLTFPLDSIKQLVFDLRPDLIIEGPCADMSVLRPEYGFPMGKCAKTVGRNDEPDRSWLHAVMEEARPQSVLVFAECCGTYARWYQELLSRSFPEIEWMFPEMGDLCRGLGIRDHQLMAAAQYLLNAGVIRSSET